MLCAAASRTDSLDQQYIEFAARTSRVFAEHSQIEPLRHFIFKDLLTQRRAIDRKGFVKHWLRPLVRWRRSVGRIATADVLIWIESTREVIVDALLPVYDALIARGIDTQLVSFGGPEKRTSSTLEFRYPARAISPIWTKGVWASLCDEIEGLRDSSLERMFSYACAGSQSLLDEVDRVLAVVKPKVVLAASTQLPGGAALMTRARPRAATLLLQHGILQPFYTPVVADWMLTWGPSSDEILVNLGVPAQKLVAVGSPRHDVMGWASGDTTTPLHQALSLPSRPTLVFFSNGNDLVRNGTAPIECARWLETVALQFEKDINVVVRLHPNEDGALYDDCSHLKVSKGYPDLATTLEGSDCIGSLCSTVLYDALLYRKPVWQFYADGWPVLAGNWKQGLASRISSQDELSDMVSRILYQGPALSLHESRTDRVFANHGRATQAVADFIQFKLTERGD